jgi:hypothetical protein
MNPSRTAWYPLLLIAPFVKGCAFPGWSSAAEFAFCCGLVAFLTYFQPRSPETSKVEKLEQEIAGLREALVALKLKIGFRQ